MFPPYKDLADERKEGAMDRWVQQQEARRHLPDDLKVLSFPQLLEQMDRKAAQCHGSRDGCPLLLPLLWLSPPTPPTARQPSLFHVSRVLQPSLLHVSRALQHSLLHVC
ncbi:hypothetical protein CRENBAI_006290 [Crenichthys baileyi]|uniref:Uncharacterized protein n=1 Tax=Crenichthys baileyi TaxID=28760 RepID=A0AAV9S071_9TELE